MPFGKRLLPLRRGEIFATRAEVDVAEMAVNGGVVTLALDCLAEESLGLGKLILFITDPAEAIEIGAIVRFFVESALHERPGFVQAGPEISGAVALVVLRHGIARGVGQGPLEQFLSAGVFLFAPVDPD